MQIGYVRVSTKDQNPVRQEIIMEDLGVERVYIDYASGKNMNRPELKKMLEFIREGDTLIVDSISRLSRNTKDLLSIIEVLDEKKVAFVSKKEAFDTSTAVGRFIITIFAAMAQLEREYARECQAEGIAAAKARGAYKGRKPIERANFPIVVAQWKRGEIKAVEAMKRLDLKPSAFYRKVKAYEDAND